MKNIIAIVGPTCSGKTTLAKFLTKYGYERIVTYTTRPKRKGEIDGVDYHYISEEKFLNMKAEGFFAETTKFDSSFGVCYYGTAWTDIVFDEDKKKVIVLDPRGVISVSQQAYNVFVVYLYPTYSALFSRGYARGDTTQELNRRIDADEKDYKLIKSTDYIDYLVEGDWPVEIIAQWVLEAVRKANS